MEVGRGGDAVVAKQRAALILFRIRMRVARDLPVGTAESVAYVPIEKCAHTLRAKVAATEALRSALLRGLG